MKLRLSIINLLFCLILFTGNSHAQTFISGAVSGTWTKDGNPYLFIDNVTVNSGSILNIEPGVQIFIGKEISMNIDGVINAIGTNVEPIVFNSTSDTVYWNRINLGVSGSVFKYCNFSGCNKGIAYIVSSIYSPNYDVDILNCEFTNCKEDAIYLSCYGDCYWNGPYGSPHRGNPNICPTIASCIFKKANIGVHLITNGRSTYYGNGYGKINGTIKNCLFENISSYVLTSEKGLSDYSRIEFFNNVISNSYQGIIAVDPFDF